jgi:dTDP-4-amino-4,6-dideoxygalactose transaminase
MTEMSAAMGLQQLKKLPDLNRKRIQNSLYLLEQLKKKQISWLTVPQLEDHIQHTFFWFPLRIDEERLGFSTRELVSKLKVHGIETRNRYWEPLYRQKILLEKEKYPHRINFLDSPMDYNSIQLTQAEKIAGHMIGLPNYPGLTKKQLDRVVDVLAHGIKD